MAELLKLPEQIGPGAVLDKLKHLARVLGEVIFSPYNGFYEEFETRYEAAFPQDDRLEADDMLAGYGLHSTGDSGKSIFN